MSNMRGFDAAQRAWENMEPSRDEAVECPQCDGKGNTPIPGDPDGEIEECDACKGYGLIDDNGQPYNPNAAAEAEADRADYLHQCAKDRRAMGEDE